MSRLSPPPKGLPRELLAYLDAIGAGRRHEQLRDLKAADPASADATRDRHLSDADLKGVEDHKAATTAHGSNGNVAGVGDLAVAATEAVAGLVKVAAAVADSTAPGSSVSSPDATDLATVIALANELKTDFNALFGIVALLVADHNTLKGNMETAGQVTP